MLVLDASVVIELLISDDVKKIARLENRLTNEVLVAPDHTWIEVASVIARLNRVGRLSDADATQIIFHFQRLNIRPIGTSGLISQLWDMRQNVRPYDAAYVAVAEALNSPLVTCDKKLSNATGTSCTFELW